ncbi:hypothetical protein MMC13_002778 [Lambiella insularis]|nr:hypothetical protein [Lambiella insularis]
MWSRVLGLSNEKGDDSSSSSTKRKEGGESEKASQRKQTTPNRKSSGNEKQQRGENPNSTNHSSTPRGPYPEGAPASVVSSYATAPSSNNTGDPLPPNLVRNTTSASQMPDLQAGREENGRDDGRERRGARRNDRATSRDRKEGRRDRSRSRDKEERRRERRERREKRRDKEGSKSRGLSRPEGDTQGISRAGEAIEGSASFSAQVGGSAFTQFPGQYDGGMPGLPSGPSHVQHMSDHVPDQFPGQFPSGSSAPYRPPLSIDQGGPGLAADYYGDTGESVATQPGVRPQAPSLIAGAQPHLMAASPVEAPPLEPSAAGGIGAAASFFSGASFQSPSTSPRPSHQPERPSGQSSGAPPQPSYSSQPGSFAAPGALVGSAALGLMASAHGENTHRPPQGLLNNTTGSFPPQNPARPPPNMYSSGSISPNYSYNSASAPVIPTLGSAAIGAAAGYMIGSHNTQQAPPPASQGLADYRPSASAHPPSQIQGSQGSFSGCDRPQAPGKQSPSSSNIPLYVAGAAGAAGLAAAAYHHNHHDPAQNSYVGQYQSSNFMPQKHRHTGPLSKFVDFFRDPEGVAEFEEYTEYIGVCRNCFEPGSTPRDAPRKHFYRRRRSNERLGNSIRVDKDTRYSSSEGESRRRNNNSWIASGIAGLGLAKVGENLFNSNRDFDDTYSVRSGQHKNSTASFNGRRYSKSPDRKNGIIHGVVSGPSDVRSTYSETRRSTSKDRKSGFAEAATGAAIAASMVSSDSRKRSGSPHGVFVQDEPHSRDRDYERASESRRRSSHSPSRTHMKASGRAEPREKRKDSRKKRKKTGFFNFANSSSSSIDRDIVVHTGSDRSRGKRSSKTKIKDHNDANAALIGLGAAAAALAAAEGRKSGKSKRRADVVAVKEVKIKNNRKQEVRREDAWQPVSTRMEEEVWESASDENGYSSVDSMLAYGVHRRRSQDSLRSDSSGTNKWSWRWGASGKKRNDKPQGKRHSSAAVIGANADLAGAEAGAAVYGDHDPRDVGRNDKGNLPPLQRVYPIATSDPSHYDVISHEPITYNNQPLKMSRPAAIPLQQPQPIGPVSSVIYASQAPYDHSYSAPAGPPIFSHPQQPIRSTTVYNPTSGYDDAQQSAMPPGYSQAQVDTFAASRNTTEELEPHKRASSPTPHIVEIEPRQPKRYSTRGDASSVRFDLSDSSKDKAQGLERRQPDPPVHNDETRYTRVTAGNEDNREKSRKSYKSGKKANRKEEGDRVADQDRKQEDNAPKEKEKAVWVAPALAGIAGAVVGATVADKASKSDESRAKKDKKTSHDYDQATSARTEKEQQSQDIDDQDRNDRQTVLAKKVAALVRRTPSPAHEDYSSFFAPTELLSKTKDKKPVDDSNGCNDVSSYAIPQIFTIEPFDQHAPSSFATNTFPGSEEQGELDRNLMRLPWQVPRLNLIQPTPPASMAGSVRGDASPVIQPADAHTADSEEDDKVSVLPKVTFGNSETREYEVVTPEEHRDEFVDAPSGEPEVSERTSEEQSVPMTVPSDRDLPIEEIARGHIPGEFGDDIDFAATLAAGLQGSGFDPAIVLDDPTYSRRNSPPGSEGSGFHERPIFEIVQDMSKDSPSTEGTSPQRGFVIGEVPPTPKDEIEPETPRSAENDIIEEESKKSKKGRNKARKRHTETEDLISRSGTTTPPSEDTKTPTLHDDSEKPLTAEVAPHNLTETGGDYFGETPKRRAAENDSAPANPLLRDAGDVLEENETSPAVDPASSQKAVDETQKPSTRDYPYDDVTTPLLNFEEANRSSEKIKSEASEYEDAASLATSPAGVDTGKGINGSLKKDKTGGLFGIVGLLSKSLDKISQEGPDEPKEATFDDFDEPKKKSKKSKGKKDRRDGDGFIRQATESITDVSKPGEDAEENVPRKLKSKKERRRKGEISTPGRDPGMVTQGLSNKARNIENEDHTATLGHAGDDDPDRGIPRPDELDQPMSFLGMRQETTEPPNIGEKAGSKDPVRRISSEETFREAIRSKIIQESFPPLPPSRPTSPTALATIGDLPALPPSRTSSPIATPSGQRRRLSVLQLSESNHAASSPSPTAVPLVFRRFPSTTGMSRSTPSSPAPSPRDVAAFSPRQRQGRPLSTEFKSSTEFRPLWLVERHNSSRHGQEPDALEDTYPPLPSSHSTSRASSVHDPDSDDVFETVRREMGDSGMSHPPSQDLATTIAGQSDHTDDLLNSQQATPTRESFFTEQESLLVDALQSIPSHKDSLLLHDTNPDPVFAENSEENPEVPVPLPRSVDPAYYNDRQEIDDLTSAETVAIGGLATGVVATALALTSHPDTIHDEDKHFQNNQELTTSSQVPDNGQVKSAASFEQSEDDFESFTSKKGKKKRDKKLRKPETLPDERVEVLEHVTSLGSTSSRDQTEGRSAESLVIEEVAPPKNTDDTWLAPLTSKKTKKGKKVKSKTPEIESTTFATAAQDLVDETLVPSQSEHLPQASGREEEPPIDPVSHPGASNEQAMPAQEALDSEWPTFITKSKKSKKSGNLRAKKGTLGSADEPMLNPPESQDTEVSAAINRVSDEMRDGARTKYLPNTKSSKEEGGKKSAFQEVEESADQGLGQREGFVVPFESEPTSIFPEARRVSGSKPALGSSILGKQVIEPTLLPQDPVLPETIALPYDDDLDLLPPLPTDSDTIEPQDLLNSSILQEQRVERIPFRQQEVLPEMTTLPYDDDLDLLPPLPPDSDTIEPRSSPKPNILQEQRDERNLSLQQAVSPEMITLPYDDDLDLLPPLPSDSSVIEPQIVRDFVRQELGVVRNLQQEAASPEAIVLPYDGDLDLLPPLPADSPVIEPQVASADIVEDSDPPESITPNSVKSDPKILVNHPGQQRELSREDNHSGEINTLPPSVQKEEAISNAPGTFAEHAKQSDAPSEHLARNTHSIDATATEQEHSGDIIAADDTGSNLPTPQIEVTTDQPDQVVAIEQPTPYQDFATPVEYPFGRSTEKQGFETPSEYPSERDTEDRGYFNNGAQESTETMFPTTKKGKKAKGGCKSLPTTPLEASSLIDPKPTGQIIFPPTETQERISRVSFEDAASVDKIVATDKWATSLKKKGKKGKKKNASYQQLDLSDQKSTALEDRSAIEGTEESQLQPIESEMVQSPDQTNTEPQETPPEQSRAAEMPEIEVSLAHTSTAKSSGDMLSSENTNSYADDVNVGGKTERREPEAQQAAEKTQEDDEWSGFSTKKGKKSKKARFTTPTSIPEVQNTAADQLDQRFPPAAANTAAEVRSMLVDPDEVTEPPVALERKEVEEDDITWGSTTKKKGKKGKKSTQSIPAKFEVLEESAARLDSTLDDTVEPTPEEAELVEGSSMSKSKKDKKGKRKALSTSISANQSEQDSSNATMEPVVVLASAPKLLTAKYSEDVIADDAATVALPADDAEEVSREDNETINLESTTSQPRFPLLADHYLDQAARTALPLDDSDLLTEKDGGSVAATTATTEHTEPQEYPREDVGGLSEPQYPEPQIEVLDEAAALALPEDSQADFPENTQSASVKNAKEEARHDHPVHSGDDHVVEPEAIERESLGRRLDLVNSDLEVHHSRILDQEQERKPDRSNQEREAASIVYGPNEQSVFEAPFEDSDGRDRSESALAGYTALGVSGDEPQGAHDEFDGPQVAPETEEAQLQAFSQSAEAAITIQDESNQHFTVAQENQGAEDDFAGHSFSNKSKRDKSKKKSLAHDQSQEPPLEVDPSLPTESATPKPESRATAEPTIVEDDSTLNETSQVANDDVVGNYVKKTKRDKKRQKLLPRDYSEKPTSDSVEDLPATVPTEPEAYSREIVEPAPAGNDLTIPVDDEGNANPRKSKKDKKKNKKSTTLDWTEQPAADESRSTLEPETADPLESSRELQPEPFPVPEKSKAGTNDDDLFTSSKGKMSKKKSKKLQPLDWSKDFVEPETKTDELLQSWSEDSQGSKRATGTALEEPAVDEGQILEPIQADETLDSSRGNDQLDEPEPVEDDLFAPFKGKKGKKKSKKSQLSDWTDELRDTPAALESQNQIDIVQREVPQCSQLEAVVTEPASEGLASIETESFSTKKSKKDKKKAKKGTSFAWDEETPQEELEAPQNINETDTSANSLNVVAPENALEKPFPEETSGKAASPANFPTLTSEEIASHQGKSFDQPSSIVREPAPEFPAEAQNPNVSLEYPSKADLEPETDAEPMPESQPSDTNTLQERDEPFEPFESKKKKKKGKRSGQATPLEFEEVAPSQDNNVATELSPFREPEVTREPKLTYPVESLNRTGSSEQQLDLILQPKSSREPGSKTFDAGQINEAETESFLPFETKKKKKGMKIGQASPLELDDKGDETPPKDKSADQRITEFRHSAEPGDSKPVKSDELAVAGQYSMQQVVEALSVNESGQQVNWSANEIQQPAAAQDEFVGFTTKKKGKKGKRGRQMDGIEWEESIAIPPELQIPTTTTEETFLGTEEPSVNRSGDSRVIEPGIATTAQEPGPREPEDDWAGFGSMQRKKSMKSKKEQPVNWEETPTVHSTSEPSQRQDDFVESGLTERSEILSSGPAFDNQSPFQPSYQSDVRQSQPDSKAMLERQALSHTIPDIVEHEGNLPIDVPISHSTQGTDEEVKGSPDQGFNVVPAPRYTQEGAMHQGYDETTGVDKEYSGKDQAAPWEQEVISQPELRREEQGEASWDIPIKNKSKKSKKNQRETLFASESFPTSRSSGSPGPALETTRYQPPLYPEELHQDPVTVAEPASYTKGQEKETSTWDVSDRQTVQDVRTDKVVEPTSERAGNFTEAGEDVWDVPTTKKGKRAKKSRKQILELEPDATAAQLPEHEQGYFNTRHETIEPVEWNTNMSGTPTSKLIERAISEPPVRDVGSDVLESTGAPLAMATTVGAGVALFEGLSRKDSTTTSRKDKKKKESNKWTDWEEKDQRGPDPEHLPTTAEHNEYHLALDKKEFVKDEAHIVDEPVTYLEEKENASVLSPQVWLPQYETTRIRDSAIHVGDSLLPGARSPVHSSVRDSGYQGTEASPTLQEVLSLPRQAIMSDESSPREANPVGLLLHGGHEYSTARADQDSSGTARDVENPLNISIEVDPAYDVSISRPEYQQRQGESPRAHDHGIETELPSLPSGGSHRPYSTSPVRHYDEQYASPVDSTTRDRSSVLFESSPSTRDDIIHNQPHASPRDITEGGKRQDELAPASPGVEISKEKNTSLFGGPVGINSDSQVIISPPGTPNSSNRRHLDTITESGINPSPLQSKSRAGAGAGAGLPEHGRRTARRSITPQRFPQQRVRSPLAESSETKEPISTDDLISRLSWPAVDEEKHSVELERNMSRNTGGGRRSVSRESALPTLATDLAKQREPDFRSISGASIRSGESISAIIRSPGVQSPGTPPLRRVDRSVSGDLRAANKRSEAKKLAKSGESELDSDVGLASSSTYDPVTDKGKERIIKMADVYEGWGDVHGSPRSPTRPPSMRKRQSLQLLDLETKLDQLLSENRLLQDAKARADRQQREAVRDHEDQKNALDEAIQSRDLYIQQKNTELNELRGILEGLQGEVSRLTEINEGLSGSSRDIASDHQEKYNQLEDDHAEVHQKWQESTRELEELRQQHASLSGGMEGIVRHEVSLALERKDAELRQMQDELETAKDQVRRLQQQILASRTSDDTLTSRDEDYFDGQCQQLCQHVQQWVLRFSKFSDMKACHSINDIADEKISDRFDNAILDGSDVDIYLADRIKRRDVFMSVVMTMVWEYIFTRYLFGMDREQRQKLKSLEKTLSEVGPARAVNKWRATTLSMLARRPAFLTQRQHDTEAVVHEIFATLALFLPPPTHLVPQIKDSLRKVMAAAVNLSIEMRTQRAEYIMLPPLQPEYDTHGDLARTVVFNAALMNERSGDVTANEDLVARGAVVRMVLFPLVVKKGDDDGVGDEEIVVCPAQVLVAKAEEGRGVRKAGRVVSAQGERLEGLSAGNQSVQSFAPSSMDAGMGARF